MTKNIQLSPILKGIILLLIILLTINITYINFTALKDNISDIQNISNVVSIAVNLLLVYFIYFFLKIKLVLKIDTGAILFKLKPWHKKFKKINRGDIETIKIVGKHFHIGLGIRGTIDYAIGNGNCLNIKTVHGTEYLISTGMNKENLIIVLEKYNYVNNYSLKSTQA